MTDPATRIGACAAGLIALLIAAPTIADDVTPSFDCKKATTRIEKKICDDEFLSFRDGALGALVRGLRRRSQATSGPRPRRRAISGLSRILRRWLRTRNAKCGGVRKNDLADCLLARYDTVLTQLSRQMARSGLGPAGRGLRPVSGVYTKKMKGFSGTVTVVEMPDLTAWVEINTVNGPTYHICNLWTASARRVGKTIVWRDKETPKCRVTLHFKGRSVTPKGPHACQRDNCGARGAFRDVKYRR
jgi:uncharacterized protein